MWVCATGARYSKSLEQRCPRTACLRRGRKIICSYYTNTGAIRLYLRMNHIYSGIYTKSNPDLSSCARDIFSAVFESHACRAGGDALEEVDKVLWKMRAAQAPAARVRVGVVAVTEEVEEAGAEVGVEVVQQQVGWQRT